MRQIFGLILLSYLLIGCTEKPKDKYEDLYVVIDEMLRFNYHDAGIVILDLSKVRKYERGQDETTSPPPPSLNFVYYDRSLFLDLFKENLIDSLDVNYMFNQIDSLKEFTLDSSRIDKQSLRFTVLKPWFKQYGIDSTYQILRKKFNANSFIRISTPLISKNGNKMLLDIDSHCGGLCGGGMTYLLEKKNGKWEIIYSRGNWIS